VRLLRVALSLGLAFVVAGCASKGQTRPEPVAVPTYAALAERYNERLEALDRLYASATFRVWYVDEDGKRRSRQLRGAVQYVRPDSLLMSFTKVGETYLLVGCNPEEYWWIELGDERKAWVGRYDEAPDRLAETDLPVHPRDLLELLALTPLPEPGRFSAPGLAAPVVTRGETRRALRVSIPATRGTRTMVVDASSNEAREVRLLDSEGRVSIEAELSRYKQVERRPNRSGARPRIAHTVEVDAGEDLALRVLLYEPTIRPDKPSERAFDLAFLLRAYRIEDVRDLGAEGVASVLGVEQGP